MKSIKRYLADFSLLAALAVALALACGGPFAGTNSARAQQQQMPAQAQPQQQPDQGQTKPTTFTGTVVKNGHYYVLRDSSGAIYKLDDPDRAKHFEGRPVMVTGELDQQLKVIHVESIEGAEA